MKVFHVQQDEMYSSLKPLKKEGKDLDMKPLQKKKKRSPNDVFFVVFFSFRSFSCVFFRLGLGLGFLSTAAAPKP